MSSFEQMSVAARARQVTAELRGPRALPAARIALLAAMAASALLLLRLGRGISFTEDDVYYYARLVNRGLEVVHYDHLSVGYLLAPHNEHLQLVGRLIYEGLLSTAGTHYGWFRLVAVGGVLLCIGLFFELARLRVGPWVALGASVLLLFGGYAWEVLLWPFDLHTTCALAAGLGALLCLERSGRRREAAACGLLVLSIGSIELGLAFVAAVAALLLTARRFRSLWIPAVPALLYGCWYVWSRQFHQFYFAHVTNPIDVARSIGEASGAVIGSLLSLNPLTGTGYPFVVGDAGWPVLSLLLLAALLLQIRRGPTRPFLWATITLVLTYWLLIGVSGRPPDSSRYIFAGSVAVLLLGAEALHARRLSPLILGVLALALAAALPKNINVLRSGRNAKLGETGVARVEAGAMQLVSEGNPDFVPARDPVVISKAGMSVLGLAISLGDYRLGAARVGPYGYPADQLAQLAPAQRDLADAVMARAGGLRAGPAPAGGTGPCSRRTPPPGQDSVAFPIPPRGVVLGASSATPVLVSARLFGPTGVPVWLPLQRPNRIVLAPSVSGAPRLWTGFANAPVEVCSP